MRRTASTVWIVATLVIGAANAHAGPCTADIAQFEQAIRAAQGTPDAGPSAPQSLFADREYQPTPESVARAKKRAQAGFDAVLARAKALDSQNDPACSNVLAEARLIYFE